MRLPVRPTTSFTGAQPFNAVIDGIVRGQNKNMNVDSFLANLAKDIETVAMRLELRSRIAS
jgi:hypothetical protein